MTRSGAGRFWTSTFTFGPIRKASTTTSKGAEKPEPSFWGGRDSGGNAKESMQAHPGRFVRFVRADVTRPEAIAEMTKGLKEGAIGLGEIKYHVALDGPEMRRVYDLATDAQVPVTIHFQEVPHFEAEGVFNTGFPRLGLDSQGVSPNDDVRRRRRFLDQRECGCAKGCGVSIGSNQTRRPDGQMAGGVSQPLRRHVSELLQQLPISRPRFHARLSRAASRIT